MAVQDPASGGLKRRLNLPLLALYGVGVTVGAGIYVLIGAVGHHAGRHAPLSFFLAAIVMGLTVGSYAELCTRYPVAAGEAAYVRAAFGNRALSRATGLIMIATGVVAAATVAIGASGYIQQFVDLPAPVIITVIIIALGSVAAWGVFESVLLAAVFTVIEVSGLLLIIAVAFNAKLPFGDALFSVPAFNAASWGGVLFASLLAFFAFTGFEDLTNMVEETRAPERNVPLAMAITLVVTTLLYALIAAIAVTAVPLDRLAKSPAPLSLVFREVAGVSPATITAIAIVATLNTIIAQMTMAIRVVYGLAQQGDLPRVFGRVHRSTATPLLATATIMALALLLALTAPFERLAELTSLATLMVFALVNLALLKIRLGRGHWPRAAVTMPLAVPVLGLLTSVGMIVTSLL
jgi:amino acid transporter